MFGKFLPGLGETKRCSFVFSRLVNTSLSIYIIIYICLFEE